MPDADGYFTYAEWERWAVEKIANIAFGNLESVNVSTGRSQPVDPKHREAYLRVQIEAVVRQALRHGRSGRGDDDPVCP